MTINSFSTRAVGESARSGIRPPPTGGRPNYGGNTSPPSFGSRYSSGVSSLYNSPVAMLPIAGEVVSALHAVNCVVRGGTAMEIGMAVVGAIPLLGKAARAGKVGLHAVEMGIARSVGSSSLASLRTTVNSSRASNATHFASSGRSGSGSGIGGGLGGGHGGSDLSAWAARREAMRRVGIPTSSQPVSQGYHRVPGTNEFSRSWTYNTPKPGGGTQQKVVMDSRYDRVPGHSPHMEAGISKGSVDSMGRAKLVGDRGGPNEKAKVNYKPK